MLELSREENNEYEVYTQEQAIIDAKRNNFTVVYGDEYHLLLDLDTHYDQDYFRRILPLFQTFVECSIKDEWKSKSGKGKHVVIKLVEPMPSLERRSMCQAILGSDRTHELLSFFKNYIDEGAERVVLFKPPVTNNYKDNSYRPGDNATDLDPYAY